MPLAEASFGLPGSIDEYLQLIEEPAKESALSSQASASQAPSIVDKPAQLEVTTSQGAKCENENVPRESQVSSESHEPVFPCSEHRLSNALTDENSTQLGSTPTFTTTPSCSYGT